MIKLSGISRFGLLCAVAIVLSCMQGAYAQSQSFSFRDYSSMGTGVAVSGHTAAIGAPTYEHYVDPDFLNPLWVGLVNVYTADVERTHWTLSAVLHADDASPENQEFGKASTCGRNRQDIYSCCQNTTTGNHFF